MGQDSRNEDPAASTDSGELQARFGDRWQIELEHTLGVWSAVHRSEDGRHIRCIIGRSAAELMAKLDVAEQAGPS